MPDSMSCDAVRAEFIEKVGLITQAEGLPRIAGRVFGMLVFDGDMVSFGDLAARLQVSRGSISSSVRLLEERGLIKRASRPGERQDYFQLSQNPYATMLEQTQKRTRSAMNEIVETIDSLPSDTDTAARLKDYARFYASIEAGLESALEELRTPGGRERNTGREAEKETSDDI